MNEGRLLALYEQIADAPDAIGRLRRFILDLAVRGKLVPQDPKDVRWTPETGQVVKRESSLGAAGRPKVRHDQYSEETQS
jgi:type I restriction enzyme, S subunit